MGAQFTGALLSQLQRWRRPGSGGAAQAQSASRVQVAAAAPMFGVAQAATRRRHLAAGCGRPALETRGCRASPER
jgi:hypothetical protein